MLKNFLTDQLTLTVAIGCKPNSFGSAQCLANGLELGGLVAALCRARSVKTFRGKGPATGATPLTIAQSRSHVATANVEPGLHDHLRASVR